MSTYFIKGLLRSLCIVGLFMSASYAQSDNTLLKAADKGDLEQVNSILAGPNDVNQKDQRGYTALMAAAAKGHLQVMEAVIERGAEINTQSNSGDTALHLATSGGYVTAVRLLLDKGANPNLRDQRGLTALEIARNSENTDIYNAIERKLEVTGELESGQDPNQTLRSAADRAIADPNELIKKIGIHNLQQLVSRLGKSGQDELKIWTMRHPTQRIRLCRTLKLQVIAELKFIQDVAWSNAATKTVSDANNIQRLWDQRIEFVSERMRELRRQEMAQATGRAYVTAARPATIALSKALPGPTRDPNASRGYFAEAKVKAEQEELAEAWTGSGNTEQLASDVNDLMFRDLGYLITTAKDEKASEKTITAIDAVILLRSQRYSQIVSELQKQGAVGGMLSNPGTGSGSVVGQQPGMRNPSQNTQGGGSGQYRMPRRRR